MRLRMRILVNPILISRILIYIFNTNGFDASQAIKVLSVVFSP